MRGTPAGRQYPSGSSLLKFDLRSLYNASAQGCRGTCPRVAKLMPGSQTPEKSTFPSVVRGVGPAGAFSLPRLPPPLGGPAWAWAQLRGGIRASATVRIAAKTMNRDVIFFRPPHPQARDIKGAVLACWIGCR